MEEGEQRRGEEMGLTVKQRQAIMNELRKQYHHASKKEKSRILNGFVDQSASQPFIRTQHPEGKGGAGKGSRPSSRGIGVQGGGPPCAHGVLASFGQALWLSLIHISEPTRLGMISYAVFCLKKKKKRKNKK